MRNNNNSCTLRLYQQLQIKRVIISHNNWENSNQAEKWSNCYKIKFNRDENYCAILCKAYYIITIKTILMKYWNYIHHIIIRYEQVYLPNLKSRTIY